MAMNFVSEKDIKKDGGGEEEEHDPRTLYERLKAVRDKKTAEIEEERALKNQFRGIDEDEAEFLHRVNQSKIEAERQKKMEELELVKAQREAMNTSSTNPSATTPASSSFTMPKIQAGALKSKAKQQEKSSSLLVRKRKRSDDEDGKDEKDKKEEKPMPIAVKSDHPILKRVGEYPSAMVKVGSLPGLGMYSSSDDSFEEDDDLSPAEHRIMEAVQSSTPVTKDKKSANLNKSASNTSLNQTK